MVGLIRGDTEMVYRLRGINHVNRFTESAATTFKPGLTMNACVCLFLFFVSNVRERP